MGSSGLHRAGNTSFNLSFSLLGLAALWDAVKHHRDDTSHVHQLLSVQCVCVCVCVCVFIPLLVDGGACMVWISLSRVPMRVSCGRHAECIHTAYSYTHTHTHTAYIYTHTHTHTHSIYIHTHCIYIHTHSIYIYTHTHTHCIHTHTHTHTLCGGSLKGAANTYCEISPILQQNCFKTVKRGVFPGEADDKLRFKKGEKPNKR